MWESIKTLFQRLQNIENFVLSAILLRNRQSSYYINTHRLRYFAQFPQTNDRFLHSSYIDNKYIFMIKI